MKRIFYRKESHRMIKALKHEQNRLIELKNAIEHELNPKINGRLRITKCKNSYQYYIDGKYVPIKDINRAAMLAKQDYLEEISKSVHKQLSVISNALAIYEEALLEKQYNKLCDGRRKLIENTVYMPTEKMIDSFMKCEDCTQHNTYEIKGDIYTNNNEHVRSKSEKIIADELHRRGIPYKYEAPLELNDGKRNIIVYPDFTVFNKRTRQIIYIEHLGMMDEFEYVYKNINKISLYEKNNILIGKNLIILHETYENPLSVKNLSKYIDEFLI